MAKKTKKSETIIDAEVQEIVPKARKHRPNTKNVEKITEEVEAELNNEWLLFFLTCFDFAISFFFHIFAS